MFSCVQVLCITTITENITKKKFKERDLLYVAFLFFIQLTVSGSGYYGIECLRVLEKLDFFFSSLSVRS